MATVNIQPGSTVSCLGYTISSGDTAHEAMADSDNASYIRTATQNRVCAFTMEDCPEDITITSVRHVVSGFMFNTRSGDTEISVLLVDNSGTTLYSDNHQLPFNFYNPVTFYGTARTTLDGSAAWTVSDINDLKLHLTTNPEDPPGLSYAQFVKAYVEVTYTSGYENGVMGIDSGDISKVNGIATADISKVNGV